MNANFNWKIAEMNTVYISRNVIDISKKIYYDWQLICYNRFEDEQDNNAIMSPDFNAFEEWLKSEVASENKYKNEDVEELMRLTRSFANPSLINSLKLLQSKIEMMNTH